MSTFSVTGEFQSRDGWQPFEVEQDAPNEDVAIEHALSSLGSRHNLKRTQIEIEEVDGR
jgi:large subunit ribosomal protein LX